MLTKFKEIIHKNRAIFAVIVFPFSVIYGLNTLKPYSDIITNNYSKNHQYISSMKQKTWVYSVAISPDNQTLVSGNYDKTINVWNFRTGKLNYTIRGHTDAVESVAISPDGKILASGSWDNKIKLWDLKTGRLN